MGDPARTAKRAKPTARSARRGGVEPSRGEQVTRLLSALLYGAMRMALYEVLRSIVGPDWFEVIESWLLDR